MELAGQQDEDDQDGILHTRIINILSHGNYSLYEPTEMIEKNKVLRGRWERNRLYLGEIRHRDKWYPGEHKGIVPRPLWDRVQAQMNSNLRTRRTGFEIGRQVY